MKKELFRNKAKRGEMGFGMFLIYPTITISIRKAPFYENQDKIANDYSLIFESPNRKIIFGINTSCERHPIQFLSKILSFYRPLAQKRISASEIEKMMGITSDLHQQKWATITNYSPSELYN